MRLRVGIAGRTFCRDLALDRKAGECLAILGRNGAGKSTLLSVLAGLREPEAGEVLLAGETYAELGARASARIRGWLPQSRSEAFSSTVLETALVGRHPHLAVGTGSPRRTRASPARRWPPSVSANSRAARCADAVRRRAAAAVDRHAADAGAAPLSARRTTGAPRSQSPDCHPRTACSAARDGQIACVMVLHEPGLAASFCTRACCFSATGRRSRALANEVISSESLSRLYGYPLREVGDGRQRWFMPGVGTAGPLACRQSPG
jgi:iron complex transport system ATP-binding protein